MKVYKYEPNRLTGLAEPTIHRWRTGHDSRSEHGDAFKDFHRGAITKPTGEQRTVNLTPVAVLGFVALIFLFLWLLLNLI
jgi:hypothetical protein